MKNQFVALILLGIPFLSHAQDVKSKNGEKVEILSNPEEVRGLVRIGLISVKARGTTCFSNVSKTQYRAITKAQNAASMLGGDKVLLSNIAVEGNILFLRASRVQFTGIVYSSVPVDTAGIIKNLVGHRFANSTKKVLSINDREPKYKDCDNVANIISQSAIEYTHGLVFLNIDVGEIVNRFIIIEQTSTYFIIAYQYQNRFVEMKFVKLN